MNKRVIIAISGITLALMAAGLFIASKSSTTTSYTNLDEFSSCLTEKGFTMYGAYWCQHCQAQKRLFSDSFKHINYIECTSNPQVCLDAEVDAYPTWKNSSGEKLEGEQTLETLSQISGCELR